MSELVLVALAAICAAVAYDRGHEAGVDAARHLGELAVRHERERCVTRQLGRLYGPRMIARPSRAEWN